MKSSTKYSQLLLNWCISFVRGKYHVLGWQNQNYKDSATDFLESEFIVTLRASLGTSFSHEIFIFLREISSFSLWKIGISWENVVPKLALKFIFATQKSGASCHH
jgi:hypothetical protein